MALQLDCCYRLGTTTNGWVSGLRMIACQVASKPFILHGLITISMNGHFNLYLPEKNQRELIEYSKSIGISPSRLIRELLAKKGIIKNEVIPYQDRGGYFSNAAREQRKLNKIFANLP